MTWDGKERRMDRQCDLTEIQLTMAEIGAKLDNIHSKVNVTNERLETTLTKHEEAIYGNGKVGLVTVMNTLKNDFERHDKNDIWFQRSMFLTGIGIIGFLVKIVFF